MSNNEWQEKHGVDQELAKKAQTGVNKTPREVIEESWENLNDAFNPCSKAIKLKENKHRDTGGFYK
jgi:hypothetical protein